MPKGAVCKGWKHFVNLIEPAGRTYCIRCCVRKIFFFFASFINNYYHLTD